MRGGAIGDFVLTFPVFSALREFFPATRLEVLGYPHIAQLALSGGLVDAVRHIEARPLAGFFARAGTLDESLRAYFAGFAIILSYLYDPDGILEANVRRCTSAQFIIGPHRPEEFPKTHATESLLKPLERLAVFGTDAQPRIHCTSTAPGTADSMPRSTIALHPGSGSERKNWPEAHWAQLIEQLVQHSSFDLLLVGGEAEGDRLQRLCPSAAPERVSLLRSRPLVEVANRLAGCEFFVGHDSGISHLAAAIGLPGLVLWGETNPVVWRPRSERFEILTSTAGLSGITPGEVFARIVAQGVRQNSLVNHAFDEP